jgi:hypothetical protein
LRQLVAIALLVLPWTAHAQTEISCDITEIKVEQLSNAVEVRLKADGLLTVNMNRDDIIDPENGWSPLRRDDIPIHITNARSGIGTLADVSTYPVNYIELLTPPESREGVGLDVRVVLYKNARMRNISVDNIDESRGFSVGWNVLFDVRKSPSRRELVVTVWSDRHEEVREEIKPRYEQNLAAEIAVSSADGLLDVNVVNAPLSAVMDEVAAVVGVPILVDDGVQRLATVRLAGVSIERLMRAIANGYGLSVSEHDGVWAISDGLPGSIAPYVAGQARVIDVEHIGAGTAIDLLPNFLLRYLHPSASGDSIIAHGPPQLLDRIEKDVRLLDRPSPLVQVRTAVVEMYDATASERVWRFLRGGRSQVSWDGSEGFVRFSHGDRSLDRYVAYLTALDGRGLVQVNVQPTMTVRVNTWGELFVGEKQYYQYVQGRWQGDESVKLASAEAGVRLGCWTQTAGSDLIGVYVSVEVSNLRRANGSTPIIDRRKATGTMLVRSGDTMVIGGGLTLALREKGRSAPAPMRSLGPLTDSFGSGQTREIVFLISAEIVEDVGPAAAIEMDRAGMEG